MDVVVPVGPPGGDGAWSSGAGAKGPRKRKVDPAQPACDDMPDGDLSPARIVDVHDLPTWFMRTPHVESHYRVHYSPLECVWSLFHLHNEVWNVWSHLVATIVWVYLCIAAAQEPDFLAAPVATQRVIVTAYVFAGLIPFCSTVAHLFHPVNARWYFWTWRLDYFGVFAAWWARAWFELWWLFGHCAPERWALSVVALTAMFLVFAPATLWRRDQRGFIPLFLMVHTPMVLFMLDPDAYKYQEVWDGLMLSAVGSGCCVLGLIFFAGRIPERFFAPGTFDLLPFQSHVVWHVFTAIGPVLCLFAGKMFLHAYVHSDMASCDGIDLATYSVWQDAPAH